MLLLDLPDCMLEQVLEHLTYDEIAKQRIVSLLFTFCFVYKNHKLHFFLCFGLILSPQNYLINGDLFVSKTVIKLFSFVVVAGVS